MRIHYSVCPACLSDKIEPALEARDHTVSGENFAIWQCQHCTLRFTQGVPDQAHIGPYYQSEDYISHSNTSKGLINGLYQQVRSITLGQKRKLIEQLNDGKSGRLLDVGCGTGEFLNTMQQAGWEVRGFEPDEGARAFAKTQYGLHVESPEQLFDTGLGQFQIITLWHVLEHVHQLQDYVARLKSLLAPGATLLVAVPNYQSSDAESYGSFWAAYDVPRHLYHFSPLAMHLLLQRHGIEVEKMKPMPFDAYYVALLSEKYKGSSLQPLQAFAAGSRTLLRSGKDVSQASSIIYICKAA